MKQTCVTKHFTRGWPSSKVSFLHRLFFRLPSEKAHRLTQVQKKKEHRRTWRPRYIHGGRCLHSDTAAGSPSGAPSRAGGASCPGVTSFPSLMVRTLPTLPSRSVPNPPDLYQIFRVLTHPVLDKFRIWCCVYWNIVWSSSITGTVSTHITELFYTKWSWNLWF